MDFKSEDVKPSQQPAAGTDGKVLLQNLLHRCFCWLAPQAERMVGDGVAKGNTGLI